MPAAATGEAPRARANFPGSPLAILVARPLAILVALRAGARVAGAAATPVMPREALRDLGSGTRYSRLGPLLSRRWTAEHDTRQALNRERFSGPAPMELPHEPSVRRTNRARHARSAASRLTRTRYQLPGPVVTADLDLQRDARFAHAARASASGRLSSSRACTGQRGRGRSLVSHKAHAAEWRVGVSGGEVALSSGWARTFFQLCRPPGGVLVVAHFL